MSPWLIEFFGSAELTRALWMLLLMTVPIWIVLLMPARYPFARHLSHPFLFPALLVPIWAYLAYMAYNMSKMPTITTVDYQAARMVARHPLLLLVFIAHIQTLNLFLGCVIRQDAIRRKSNAVIALLLSWFFGPLGLLFYAVQRAVGR